MNSTKKLVGVVVPTYNGGRYLKSCLESIVSGQTLKPDRVIIVDGGSTDNTLAIAAECGVPSVITSPNRCSQRNLGKSIVSTDYVLFIDQDMILEPEVIKECYEMSRNDDDSSAIVIRERMGGNGYWSAVRGFQREFFDVWWLEAARWFSSEVFDSVHGYDTEMVGFEDWDLDERVRKQGVLISRSRATVIHDEGGPSYRGLLRKKAYAAEAMSTFSDRHPARAKLCFGALARARLFLRQPKQFLYHPVLGLGCLALSLGEYAVGTLKLSSGKYHVPEQRFSMKDSKDHASYSAQVKEYGKPTTIGE